MFKLKLAGLAALAIVFVSLLGRIVYLEYDRANIAFQADSVSAEKDITHVIDLLNTHVAYRRVIQLKEIEKNEINKKLQTESKLRAVAEAKIRRVNTGAKAPVVVQNDSTITYTFNITDTPPFDTLRLDFETPPPPDSASVTIVASFLPINLNIDAQCGQLKNGIRPAILSIQTPSWIGISLDTLHQSREVCNPDIRVASSSVKKYVVGGVVGGILTASTIYYLTRKRDK